MVATTLLVIAGAFLAWLCSCYLFWMIFKHIAIHYSVWVVARVFGWLLCDCHGVLCDCKGIAVQFLSVLNDFKHIYFAARVTGWLLDGCQGVTMWLLELLGGC